jgi:hypothetical protein
VDAAAAAHDDDKLPPWVKEERGAIRRFDDKAHGVAHTPSVRPGVKPLDLALGVTIKLQLGSDGDAAAAAAPATDAANAAGAQPDAAPVEEDTPVPTSGVSGVAAVAAEEAAPPTAAPAAEAVAAAEATAPA